MFAHQCGVSFARFAGSQKKWYRMKKEIKARRNAPNQNLEPGSAKPYDQLIRIAEMTCADEGIVLESLASQKKRALICFWCSTCKKTHPLTDIALKRRRKLCRRCNNSVKLYSSSNKFGKIRRRIFNRYLEFQSSNDLSVLSISQN